MDTNMYIVNELDRERDCFLCWIYRLNDSKYIYKVAGGWVTNVYVYKSLFILQSTNYVVEM